MADKFNRGATILVVDDDHLNLTLLETNLKASDYNVLLAETGVQALALLKEYSVDIVLLDIIMPEMDGYEVLSQMKSDVALQHIPVLVISRLDEMESIARCIEIGATDYLSKPFNAVLLHARINASLTAKHLYDMQQTYTQQLQARNEELDAFASTVAHDLKAPIATVVTMTELLRLRYDHIFDESGRDLADRIVRSGRKAADILEALMKLANLRRQQPTMYPLTMGQIVAEVMERVALLQERYQAKMVLPQSWPAVSGYAPWVEEVWVNYITNAFKYGGEPPYVELGSTKMTTGQVRFWVRDNGAGIPRHMQAQIFTPFNRLAKHKDTEGHGLGLSIVERIVTRLGGEVGVESEVGKGSMFWFTLLAT